MMFDTDAGATAAGFPKVLNLEFLRVQLSPLLGGGVHVAVTATCIDEQIPELLEQEIVSDRVPTIEGALALVVAHAQRAFQSSQQMEKRNG